MSEYNLESTLARLQEELWVYENELQGAATEGNGSRGQGLDGEAVNFHRDPPSPIPGIGFYFFSRIYILLFY